MADNIDWIFTANLAGLDLNQDPESLLNQLDSAQQMVEARMRQLEAAEERRRPPEQQNQISLFPGRTEASVNNDQSTLHETNNLVANGHGINSDVSRADEDRASFYNCNICLEMATEPILTCCGHLFCWPCFYQVPNINPTYKECPVCRGEVSDNTITPIYGNGGESQHVVETDSGLRIPPRPRAHRAESFRQQMMARNLNDLGVEGAIRHIMASAGATVGPETQEGDGGHNVLGSLPENGDSLSSSLLVLSGVDGLIEELETVINSRRLRDNRQASVRGRRRRNSGPRESGEGGRGGGESRRRRLN